MALREKFINSFESYLGPNCSSLYHNDYMCMFDVEPPGSPFVTGNWGVYFLPEQFSMVVPWIMQNRKEFDVLVHPNRYLKYYAFLFINYFTLKHLKTIL